LLNSEVATGHCGQVEGIPRTVVRLTWAGRKHKWVDMWKEKKVRTSEGIPYRPI
jgi:hypothetical protein